MTITTARHRGNPGRIGAFLDKARRIVRFRPRFSPARS
jgi:hypothetical protein